MSRVRRLVRAGAAGFSRLHSLAGNSQQTACDSILTGDHAPTDDAPAELVAVKAGNMNGVAIFDFSSPLVCGTVALGSFASGLNRQVSGTLSLKASVLVITIPVSAAHCGRPPGARVFCGNVGHVNAGCAND